MEVEGEEKETATKEVFFFSQRAISSWNRLQEYVVDAPSVNSFKKRLDDWFADVEI